MIASAKREPSSHQTPRGALCWFAILDAAVYRGDFIEAAKAQRALKIMGIDVKYPRPTTEQGEAVRD